MAVLQSTALPSVAAWGVRPDLMLLVVVSWEVLRGSARGLVWCILGGMLVDFLSVGPFGLSTVALVIIGSLAGLLRANVFRLGLGLPVGLAALGTILYDLMMLVGLRIAGNSIAWGDAVLRIILPGTMINAISMPLVFFAMRWLHRRTGPEEIGW